MQTFALNNDYRQSLQTLLLGPPVLFLVTTRHPGTGILVGRHPLSEIPHRRCYAAWGLGSA